MYQSHTFKIKKKIKDTNFPKTVVTSVPVLIEISGHLKD